MAVYQQVGVASLQDAFQLFRRLGIDVPSLSAQEFTVAYFDLAKRYHPDVGYQPSHDLMANINAAKTVILATYHPGTAPHGNPAGVRERMHA